MTHRFVIWGDRKHWEVTAGRLNVSRWCSGAPCHLPGARRSRHPLRVRLWRSRWYLASSASRARTGLWAPGKKHR